MGDVATNYGGWPNDSLVIILLDSSHAFDATDTVKGDINANELGTGAGYTADTKTLGSVTSSQPSAGVWELGAASVQWTASGGDIGPADDAAVYDDTITSPADALLFDIDFGGSQTAGDGTTFNINWNANGICRIS